MQKFILENIYGVEDLPQAQYVKLTDDLKVDNKRKESFKEKFNTLDDYMTYFDKLYTK